MTNAILPNNTTNATKARTFQMFLENGLVENTPYNRFKAHYLRDMQNSLDEVRERDILKAYQHSIGIYTTAEKKQMPAQHVFILTNGEVFKGTFLGGIEASEIPSLEGSYTFPSECYHTIWNTDIQKEVYYLEHEIRAAVSIKTGKLADLAF